MKLLVLAMSILGVEKMSFKNWFLASRPKTLPASAAPVLLGGAMASDGSFFVWFVTLITALTIQIATNLINDYCDHERGADGADRTGPTRMTGKIPLSSMRLGIGICLLFAVLLGAYLVSIGGYPILIIGVLSLFFAFVYTGGPYPLAYHGLGDVFVMIFFGPVAVCGTYYLLTGAFNWLPFILSFALGSIIVAILVVNNLRDRECDALVSKNTLAVKFGDSFSRNQYLILMTLGVALPLSIVVALSGKVFLLIALLIHLLFSYQPLKQVSSGMTGAELNNVLAKTGQAALLFAIACSVCWNL